MKPIIQTKLSSIDGKVRGNCLRACLASILEMEIDNIPAFEDEEDGVWFTHFYKWVVSRDLEFYGTCHDTSESSLESYFGIDGYYIAYGESPREYVRNLGAYHAVVFHKGKLAHDPHPEGGGILNVKAYFMIERKQNNG